MSGGAEMCWMSRLLRSRRVEGATLLRALLGVVLLIAAALKAWQLSTEPVAEDGLLTSRGFLIALVEFELLFGLCLLFGLVPRVTWPIAMLCFVGFSCVALYKALSGAASCGCFGKVEVNPWYTFAFDVGAVGRCFDGDGAAACG
ncbi:MAG: MauE/DoxX family redox-associated membrane protein [Pirellulaceae bacterium]